jgi:hypothetical protein
VCSGVETACTTPEERTMPTYRITEWPSSGRPADAPTWHLEADTHDLEAGWHVFRRTALVMGLPRAVVVRRLQETAVAQLDIVAPSTTG